jgi:hypothetical protein
MRMGFGFGTYMPVTIGTFGQITTIGPRVEMRMGELLRPPISPLRYRYSLLVTIAPD